MLRVAGSSKIRTPVDPRIPAVVRGLEMRPRYKSFDPSSLGPVMFCSSLIQRSKGSFGVVQLESFFSL